MLIVLFALVVLEFTLAKITPVDPAKVLLGPGATASSYENTRHRLGLDQPIPVQFYRYVHGLVRGDFGISLRTGNSVGNDLATALPATVELCLAAAVFATIFALLLAISGALRWKAANSIRADLVAGASAPPFLLAFGAILLLSNRFGWLPSAGQTSVTEAPTGPTHFLLIDSLVAGRYSVFWDGIRHLVLPAICVGIASAMAVGRVLRSSLLDNLNSDHTRTAVAKGLTKREVLRRHVFRNSLGPALSMAGLQLGVIFASDVIVEEIFSWPGIGSYLAQSIPGNDFPAIAAVTLLLGFGYVVVNALVDMSQALADPRIRL
jgi:peptide/nickel transport system permease protein